MAVCVSTRREAPSRSASCTDPPQPICVSVTDTNGESGLDCGCCCRCRICDILLLVTSSRDGRISLFFGCWSLVPLGEARLRLGSWASLAACPACHGSHVKVRYLLASRDMPSRALLGTSFLLCLFSSLHILSREGLLRPLGLKTPPSVSPFVSLSTHDPGRLRATPDLIAGAEVYSSDHNDAHGGQSIWPSHATWVRVENAAKDQRQVTDMPRALALANTRRGPSERLLHTSTLGRCE